MAEIQKRSRPRNNPLGMPPTPEETRGNLMEPEVAPAPLSVVKEQRVAEAPEKPSRVTRKVKEESIDGRTLRRTGRTEQFSTRVHPEYKKQLFKIAKRTGKNYNVILEESLAMYVERMGQFEKN